MVGILKLASDYNCEEKLGEFILSSLIKGEVPSLGVLQTRYQPAQVTPPSIEVKQHALSTYNKLLSFFKKVEVCHA